MSLNLATLGSTTAAGERRQHSTANYKAVCCTRLRSSSQPTSLPCTATSKRPSAQTPYPVTLPSRTPSSSFHTPLMNSWFSVGEARAHFKSHTSSDTDARMGRHGRSGLNLPLSILLRMKSPIEGAAALDLSIESRRQLHELLHIELKRIE